jgi:hypothetical protein
MRQKQKDINQLREQYAYLENQYRHLQDSKADMEYQQNKQIQFNADTIQQLVGELDDLRFQNQKAEEEQDRAIDQTRQVISENEEASRETASF